MRRKVVFVILACQIQYRSDGFIGLDELKLLEINFVVRLERGVSRDTYACLECTVLIEVVGLCER